MRMIKVDNALHEVEFVCDSRNTRSGFAHDATLFIDGCKVASASCHYLNRTWERWCYESVCLACVSNAIADRTFWMKEDFKSDRGLSRVAGKAKAEFADMVDHDLRIITLREIKAELSTKYF